MSSNSNNNSNNNNNSNAGEEDGATAVTAPPSVLYTSAFGLIRDLSRYASESMRSLSTEEVQIESDNASITNSTITSGLSMFSSTRRSNVPEPAPRPASAPPLRQVMSKRSPSLRSFFLQSVAEDENDENHENHYDGNNHSKNDVVSVLTYDPQHPNQPKSIFQLEEALLDKQEELHALEHSHGVARERLEETTKELTSLQKQHHKEHLENQLIIEELQSQKVILQERLDLMEDELQSQELYQGMVELLEQEAPSPSTVGFDDTTTINTTTTTTTSSTSQQVQAESQHGNNNNSNNNNNNNTNDDESPQPKKAKNGFKLRQFINKESINQKLKQSEDLHREKDEYIAKLRSKLTEAMRNIHVMSEQMTLMEDTLADQVQKLRQQIKTSENQRLEQEVDFLSKLDIADHEKRETQQTMLARLESKQDRIVRLEDLVDELRETCNNGSGAMAASTILALDALKKQYDDLFQEKQLMTDQYHDQLDHMRRELTRLQQANEKKQRKIERMETNDALTALEHQTLLPDALRRSCEDLHYDKDNDEDYGKNEDNPKRPTLDRRRRRKNSRDSTDDDNDDNDNDDQRNLLDDDELPPDLTASMRHLMDSISVMNVEMEDESALNDAFSRKSVDYAIQTQPPSMFRKRSNQRAASMPAVSLNEEERRKTEKRLNRFL